MGRYHEKLIEHKSGIGKLLLENEFIDEVNFDIRIFQRFLMIGSSSGVEEIPERKRIAGFVELIKSKKDITGNYLKLSIPDDSDYFITITTGDYISKKYEFVGGPGN